MAYHVLARKWRPGKFADLVGQEHVVSAISNALDNHRLHHAYLFTGTRGVGKTTIARIFAKSLNCEKGMTSNPCGVCGNCQDIEAGRFVDLLEIDAASRTKVEDTRELLDNVQYKPTRGEYKVYLIDEVHMLSKHSFNALLKTLEEPPPHIKFLLATTDPQKLPITILSRCLQFNLKALTREQISQQLQHVLTQEQITHEPSALGEIAKAAQGSMRDALSLTDQAIAQGNGNVTAPVVADMLGLMDRNQVLKLLHAALSKDNNATFALVEELAAQAPDFSQLMSEMQALLHQVALTQYVPDACKLEGTSAKAIYYLAGKVAPEMVQLQYQILLQGRKDLPYAVDGRSGLEMTLLRMLAFTPDDNKSSLKDFPFSEALAEKKTADFVVPDTPQQSQSAPLSQNSAQQQVPATTPAAPIAELLDDDSGIEEEDNDAQGSTLEQEMTDIIKQSEQLRDPPPQSLGDAAEHQSDAFIAQSSVEQPESPTNLAPEFPEPVAEDDSANDMPLQSVDDCVDDLSGEQEAQGKTDVAGINAQESDPYFHPEDLSHYEDMDNASSGELQAFEPFSPEAETSAPDFVNTESSDQQKTPDVLDTKALLDLHSNLQQSVSEEVESDNRTFENNDAETDSNEMQDAIPENPFKYRAAAIANTPADVENDTSAPHVIDTVEESDSSDEVVDFDVPLRLDGKKVTEAKQLDTWSQLIEQAGLTGLPKQLVLHSNYHKDGNQISLVLNPEKQHLVSDANVQTIEEALSNVLQQQVQVSIKTGEVKDTPYSVQKAIDNVRMNHAKEVIHQDANVQLMQQKFAANVIDESIKPR